MGGKSRKRLGLAGGSNLAITAVPGSGVYIEVVGEDESLKPRFVEQERY